VIDSRGILSWAFALLLSSLLVTSLAGAGDTPSRNGFDLSDSRVPVDQILRGTARDGARAVDAPRFVDLEAAARWVAPENAVLGLVLAGEARAYPEHLLDYHQVVNDRVGEHAVVVIWDPIAGIPLAFEREVDGRMLDFGVSGLVYRGHCLLYDRQTESLWLPIEGRAVAGPLAGAKWRRVRVVKRALASWAETHPETKILERPLLKQIDYRFSPFSAYWSSPRIPFPVGDVDPRFHPKEIVLGVSCGGDERAFLSSLVTAAGGRVVDEVGGVRLRVAYDPASATFFHDAGDQCTVIEAYWFAWQAFRPGVRVWQQAEVLEGLPLR
jgi:hypothetical protein